MTDKKIIFKNNDYDIKIKQNNLKKSNGLNSHSLTLDMEGEDLNVKIVNMLRRSSANDIPVYGFPIELINIIENTSIAFNNDMMKLDLSLLPLYNIDSKLYELDPEYWYNVNYADKERQKHVNEQTIEFFVSYHNNSADIVRVTTNDAKVYVDNVQIEMYDKKYPILLIELKANQTFKCHMRAALGIAERRDDGAIWKATKRGYYKIIENDDEKDEKDEKDENDKNDKKNKYELTIVGNEQFSEYNLLIKTCQFLIKKLQKIKKTITDDVNSGNIVADTKIKFTLENEDHTIGEPINYELQDHEDIILSGFSKTDQLIKTGVITAICSDSKKSPINAFIDSIDVLTKKIHKIGYLLVKLSSPNENETSDSDSESDEPVKNKKKKIITKKNNKH